ncbi:MAG: zinc-dependent metalloprotease [Armatimonadetes bacterium]|nr:zinc-dependent metalloprotease [Armatimonadota bacterium]
MTRRGKWLLVMALALTAAPAISRAQDAAPSAKSYEDQIKGATRLEGLFTLYRQKEKLLLEVKPEQLGKPYLAILTLESGLGERGILGGLPLNDFVFLLRRVHDTVHVIQRNVHFRSDDQGPVERAVQRSFSDSVMASLKIEAEHPDRKTLLLSLNGLLLSDLPGLAADLASLGTSYALSTDRSYFGPVKAFPQNVEVESVLQFSAARGGNVDALPDGRYLTLRVHYSLSEMPPPGYKPRLADPRIGYFLTAHKEFSDDRRPQAWVRYINRWRLEKQDPSAPISAPKKPIVFWLENAIPVEYRGPIRQGVLMWNKAFERLGFKDAVVVQQMPDDADWDPADVRYNVIRWITSSQPLFGAMGPSRVDPFTGEILDADILFEGETMRGVRSYYRRYLALPGEEAAPPAVPLGRRSGPTCAYGLLLSENAALGNLARLLQAPPSGADEPPREYIEAFLREMIAHEVGHTLGLRHNFAGSNFLRPDELHNPEITRQQGITASVMEYTATNLAPPGTKQGEYHASTLGPYDLWAIEYGYCLLPGETLESELPELRLIASQSAVHGHDYATDEDLFDDLCPTAARFDLSNDPLTWACGQLDLIRTLWPKVDRVLPQRGASYADLRRAFDTLYFEYLDKLAVLTRYVGGQYVHKHQPGDPGGRPPFEMVPLARQREALRDLEQYALRGDAFRFRPQALNRLAVERYWHWGVDPATLSRTDYPVHDRVLGVYQRVLNQLLEPRTLARLRDAERKTPPGAPTLTMAELFGWLNRVCWSEVVQPGAAVRIDSFRRGLQREHLTRLIRLAVGATDSTAVSSAYHTTIRPTATVPEDARALAAHALRALKIRLSAVLKAKDARMDTPTRAHLEDSLARIGKALAARYQQGL